MSGLKYEFDDQKSKEIKKERGLGFEEIVTVIENGNIIDSYDHPDQRKYPGQKIYEIDVYGYVWRVPYIKTGTSIRLITGYPCRKATKKHDINKGGSS